MLQLGPTPKIDLARWRFTLREGAKPLKSWTWAEFEALPRTRWTGDIHCVTKWSKFDTAWEGVTVDDLLAAAGIEAPTAYLLAEGHDDYTTNVPVADLTGGRAMVATRYAGEPIPPDHGGPARLLVPHLYFWKSAKWVKGLRFTQKDEAGSGSCAATTCMAIPGASSASPGIEGPFDLPSTSRPIRDLILRCDRREPRRRAPDAAAIPGALLRGQSMSHRLTPQDEVEGRTVQPREMLPPWIERPSNHGARRWP